MIRSKIPPRPDNLNRRTVKLNRVHSPFPFKPGRGLGLTRGGQPSLGNGGARRDVQICPRKTEREGGGRRGEGQERSDLVYPMQAKQRHSSSVRSLAAAARTALFSGSGVGVGCAGLAC